MNEKYISWDNCYSSFDQSILCKDISNYGQSDLLKSNFLKILEERFRLWVSEMIWGIGIQILTLILGLHVASFTCWLRKCKPVRSVNQLDIGQLVVEHDQSMLGKLKSPRIITQDIIL